MVFVQILASYDEEKKFPAIIRSKIKKGIAILSGVHFDFDPFLMNNKNKYVQKILPNLIKSDEKRKKLFRYLISEF